MYIPLSLRIMTLWFGSHICNSFAPRRSPHEPSVISELSRHLLSRFQVLTHSDAQSSLPQADCRNPIVDVQQATWLPVVAPVE